MAHVFEPVFLGDGRTIVCVGASAIAVCWNLVLRSVAKLDYFTEEATVLIFHLVPMLAGAERSAAETIERLESCLLSSGLSCSSCCRLLFLFLLSFGGFGGSRKVRECATSSGGSRIWR